MDLESFLPPFFGVLAAFGLNYLYSYFKDLRVRRDLLRGIKTELEQNKELLNGKGNLLQRQNWDSAIYSGNAMLVRHEVRSRLGQIYFRISNHNYEAQIVRKLGEEARQAWSKDPATGNVTYSQAKNDLWVKRSKRLGENENALRTDIDGLLHDQGIWSEDC